MKAMIYEGRAYQPVKVEYDRLGYDDTVCVNGIIGYVDFPGSENLFVVDENKRSHHILVKDIKTIFMLHKCTIGLPIGYSDGKTFYPYDHSLGRFVRL